MIGAMVEMRLQTCTSPFGGCGGRCWEIAGFSGVIGAMQRLSIAATYRPYAAAPMCHARAPSNSVLSKRNPRQWLDPDAVITGNRDGGGRSDEQASFDGSRCGRVDFVAHGLRCEL